MTRFPELQAFKCLDSLLRDAEMDRRFGRCVMAIMFFPYRNAELVGIIYVEKTQKGGLADPVDISVGGTL